MNRILLITAMTTNYQISIGFSAFILMSSYIAKVFSKIIQTKIQNLLQNINILGKITDELTHSPCYASIISQYTNHVC